MKRDNNKVFGWIITCLLTITFLGYLLFLGESIIGTGDDVKHFQISKFSWQYFHLFFDHWGKPLYTLLSSPFAQFGFKGVVVFNIGLYALTSVFLLKICKEFSLKYNWLVVVFCFSSPIYFMIVLTGLTEVLMATIGVLVLYLFLKQNFFLGCILLSFSLFSRPESNMIIPWYVLFLVFGKNYKYIPLIFVGPLIYSVLGVFHYHDFFWIINNRPYSSTGTYGSGDLFHFVLGYRQILGSIVSFLFVLGGGIIFMEIIKKKFSNIKEEIAWLLLVLFPAVSVIIVHSFVWWKGMQGSAGYFRVLVTIVPFACLIALYAINKTVKVIPIKINRVKDGVFVILLLLGSLTVFLSLKNIQVDKRFIVEQKVLLNVADWYKDKGEGKKIYYMPPFFAYKAKIDPFSKKGFRDNMKRFHDKQTPSNNMKEGELLLWEGQFSENEGKISLLILLKDENLILIKSFYPVREVTFYGKQYSAHLFIKSGKKDKNEPYLIDERYYTSSPNGPIKNYNYYLKKIKNDEEWMKSLKQKSLELNIAVDSLLSIDARRWAKQNGY